MEGFELVPEGTLAMKVFSRAVTSAEPLSGIEGGTMCRPRGGGPEPGMVGTGLGLTFGLGAVARGAGGRTPFVPGDEPAAPAWLQDEDGWDSDLPDVPKPAPLFDDPP